MRAIRTGLGLVLPVGLLFLVMMMPVQAAGQAGENSAASDTQRSEVSSQPGTAGAEAAEKSHEGETDEEQFQHSDSVRFLARKTGMSLEHAYWLAVLLNFGVIAVGIGWLSKKHLPSMFRNRTVSIQKAMEEARKASEEANRRLAEIEARLSKLDVEIGGMRAAAEQEAAAEETRIKATTAEDARKVVESAEQEIAAAAKAARRELTVYAADLAVTLAKKQIHVDAATDQGLVRNFAGQLSAEGNGPRKGSQ